MSKIVKTTNEQQLRLAETAANISDVVHSDQAKFSKLYDRVADEVSGFPGIYVLIAHYAVALEELGYEDELWIKLCDRIGAEILKLPASKADVGERHEEVLDRVQRIVRKTMKDEGWAND